MADAEKPPMPTPHAEEDGWRHYVRDAIQELRQDVRDLRGEMKDLRAEMRELRTDMTTRFYWLIGLMVTLTAMQSALMVALLKV
jgi:hypothetical protein